MNLFPSLKKQKLPILVLVLIILLLLLITFLFISKFFHLSNKYYTATITTCPGSECPGPCTPNCPTNSKCGDSNGCGGTCIGECSLVAFLLCEKVNGSYQCVCHSDCAGKICGAFDGCGVECYGSCPVGQYCDAYYGGPGISNGYECKKNCTPNCPTNAKCGQSDGCYHQCSGSCQTGYSCAAYGPGSYSCKCTPYCTGKTCGADNGCGYQCPGPCPKGSICKNNQNLYYSCSCAPNCPTNAKCGDSNSNGCGGICSGSCPSNQTCAPNGAGGYKCICKSNCQNQSCGGSDGCGGTCSGSCANKNEECKYVSIATSGGYQCVKKCTPICTDPYSGKQKYCGSGDGCGGHCLGDCENGKTCINYICVQGTQPSNAFSATKNIFKNAAQFTIKIFSDITKQLANLIKKIKIIDF